MTPPSATPLPPALTTSFDTVRLLGTGGMGAVWLVRDRFLDRLVALKVLRSEHADPAMRERFLREARTSARLEHPHIIDVYRADETDGVVWFTMRYINGESLGDRLRDRGALPVAETLRILREVSWGLAYAHARGVVHRDIKPDNILLDRESGRAVITDFGIARDATYDSSLTLLGNVLGSVHYMSPEQGVDEVVDGRSDVYALGCVAYHMLTGAPPFEGTAQSVLVAHVTKPALSLVGTPTVPTGLAALIDSCLSKAPDDRPATADLLASTFDDLLREVEAAQQAQADASPAGVLSEDEARLVWQRAAQLQAEAAHRMERHAALEGARVARSGSNRPTDDRRPSSSADVPLPDESYRVRDVEAAAVEAGISRQYVAIALAELRAGGTSTALATPVSDRDDRRMTRLLGTTDRAISVSRVIPASPKATLQALGAVFTSAPHQFTLQDTINGHPLDGGIMRFKVPRLLEAYANPFVGFASEKQLRFRLEQIELFDVNVTLHPRGTAATPACEVVLTGDLRAGLARNVALDLVLMAMTGVFAFLGTAVGLGATLGVPVLSAAPLIAGAGAAVLAGAAEGAWYRWLFRRALKGTMDELQQLLQQIERQLAQQALFSGEPVLPERSEPR
ncbi:serine/threonine-protein kinase [Gemmatimonas sp.]|uniref:serine/threonine-protein kinase n=1 Tax=Gemmatimonas sp. TaxID=1962908 RepID=UPI0025C624D6|nr:serine/threonine-protein kinase [Gemmatimonas sp.]MCA2990151.1 serine/threonine protein kinase [Gemmatimonas sp.]